MAKSFLSYFSGDTAKYTLPKEEGDTATISQIIDTTGNILEEPDQETLEFIARRNSARLQRLLRPRS